MITMHYEGAITGFDMVLSINNKNSQFFNYLLLSNYSSPITTIVSVKIDICDFKAPANSEASNG